MKRLVKLVLLAAAVGGLVALGRKLMGGLGPQPGAPQAPKEWPSLVPDPPTTAVAADPGTPAPDGTDAGSATDPGTGGAAARIAPTEDSGPNS